MTKDKAALLGLVAALLAFAANQTGLFPVSWYPAINALSGAVAIVAAFLKDNRSVMPVK